MHHPARIDRLRLDDHVDGWTVPGTIGDLEPFIRFEVVPRWRGMATHLYRG